MLKSEDNCQHLLLYLSMPCFCSSEGTTYMLHRPAILKHPCAKATLAGTTLYGKVL